MQVDERAESRGGNGARSGERSTHVTGPARGQDAAELRDELRALVLAKGHTRRPVAFQLSSGGTSHDYVDLRHAVAEGPDLALAARALLAAIEERGIDFDAIGGMTMGADPVAHAVALLSGRSWFSVRKSEKTYGSGRRIEGADLGPGSRTILFEDTVSTGRSVLEALQAVVASGAEVLLTCTLLDRGDAAGAELRRLGVEYLPLLTYRDLGIDPLLGGLGASTPQATPQATPPGLHSREPAG